MNNPLEDICGDCGAKFGEHYVGGKYHPNPLTPEAEKREKDFSAYVIDCEELPKEKAFQKALNRAIKEERKRIRAKMLSFFKSSYAETLANQLDLII